jgi:crossover junction endodeoxyribonuclease RusA
LFFPPILSDGHKRMKTKLTLPFPPSLNSLFATNWKTKRRHKSADYDAWIFEAGLKLNIQRPQAHPSEVAITIQLHKPDNRKRDLDNLNKAICDLLVTHGIIKDDSRIVSLHTYWDQSVNGAEITIEDAAPGIAENMLRDYRVKPTSHGEANQCG